MQSGTGTTRRKTWIYAIVGIVLAVVILGVGSGMGWWQQNGAAFGIEAEAAQQAGALAGAQTDQQGCLEQAARRHAESTEVAALGITNSFLGTCLPAARQTTRFCAVPPGATEIRAWRTDRCNAISEDLREACGTLIGSVQQICKRLTPTSE